MKKLVSLLMAAILLLSACISMAELNVIPITEVDTENYTIDPEHPLKPLLNGLYQIDVTLSDGSMRSFYHYVPDSAFYRQPAIGLAIPGGAEVEAFMTDTGWKTLADEQGFTLIVMTAGDNGWQADEAEYTQAAFDYMDARKYMQMQDSAFYMVGYGDAANAVMAHAVTNSELLAGAAAFGVDDFDTALLDAAKAEESGEAGVTKAEVALPIWIGANEKTAAVEELIAYWKNADNCGDEAFSNAEADEIYQPIAYLSKTNELTYANVSRVMVTIGQAETEKPDFTAYLWNSFLRRVRRQDSGDINALRYFVTNDELGMDYYTTVINGTTYEYWVYVPTAVREGKAVNVPVLVFYHGSGGSGEDIGTRSGIYKIAEERTFIAVLPTGSRTGKFKAGSGMNDDGYEYFEIMRQNVLANYPADETRVYVAGHSLGAGFATQLAAKQPLHIAAVAAGSMTYDLSTVEGVDTSVIMPYMVTNGEKDKHYVEGGDAYQQVPPRVALWRERYGITLTEEETRQYKNGSFYGYDFYNGQGITLIREQWVIDKIHAITPEEMYTMYDFLCNYSRGADGTCYYMGQAIVP